MGFSPLQCPLTPFDMGLPSVFVYDTLPRQHDMVLLSSVLEDPINLGFWCIDSTQPSRASPNLATIVTPTTHTCPCVVLVVQVVY